MADDDRNDQSPEQSGDEPTTEQYSFSDDSSQEYGSNPMKGGTENLMSLVRNPRVLTVVGGIFAIYILLHLFSSGDEEPIDQQVDDVATTALADFEMPVESPEVSFIEPTVSMTSIDQMLSESTETQQRRDDMEEEIASLNRQSKDFRSKIKMIDDKLDRLSNLMEKSNKQISALIEKDVEREDKKPEIVLEDYQVRAVIEGRAWLQDQTGNNITVKVGDKIPTYGRVTEIRPIEGVVLTTSGRVISFGSDD